MSKSRSEYATYTPELVNKLKRLTKGLSRADGVKEVAAQLNLSPRQARSVFAQHIEPAVLSAQTAPTKVTQQMQPSVKGRAIRRLFWDIETSPNKVLSWRVGYKINIDHDNIIEERRIVTIAYKWEGEKEVYALSWDKNQDDRAMLIKFLEVANEADELVHHNGDSFDLPWFKTRCLFHGLTTIPDYKTIDTLQWARRNFLFNSNKLDYIASFLGFGHKIKTDFGLWKKVLNGDEKALQDMLTYNKRDVELLERVWKRLQAVVKTKSHAGVLQGSAKWTCPRDGSTNVKLSKTRATAGGVIQYQMQCLDCGSYYTIGAVAYTEYVAAKKKR